LRGNNNEDRHIIHRTEGRSLPAVGRIAIIEEAKENLVDAIHEMQRPIDISSLPKREVVLEEIEV